MLEGITIVLLVVMLGATLIGVADRYVLGIGLAWTEELSRFLLVWASLLAAAVAAKRQRHFSVTVLLDRLPGAARLAVDAICLAALGVAIVYGLHLVRLFHAQTAPALGIPMSVIYAAVPISGGLMVFYVVRDLVRRHRSPGHGGS